MAQGVLPITFEAEKKPEGVTARAGLPLYIELALAAGLLDAIRERLTVRDGTRGWSNVQVVMALILLNISGGDRIQDLEALEMDDGFKRILRRAHLQHLPRSQRRELERIWMKEGSRTVPSPRAVLDYLVEFHDAEQEAQRTPGKAFIPKPNAHLMELRRIHQEFLAFAQKRSSQKTATLDTDATLIETYKSTALPCYKGFKAYQPLNVWWAEQGLVLHSEFRDGNVPAGYEILRVVLEALDQLPEGVEDVRVRSDTAGYQHPFIQWLLDAEKHPRFGVINFAIGVDVTPAFKKDVAEVSESDWKREYRLDEGGYLTPTNREWAEVCHVSGEVARGKHGDKYRYLATRELLDEQPLPGMEQQQTLPFPTMTWNSKRYKVFGIVTSYQEKDGWTGDKVIDWLHERCGKSEEAHAVMKNDLAGGTMPSDKFGVNAAWWAIMLLAHNLNAVMKRDVLGGSWVNRRMKAIRYHIINVAGRVLKDSRQLLVRLSAGVETLALIIQARARILAMASGPAS